MAINWGPHFIVPSEVAKTFSGIVVLRENFDEALLRQELETLDPALSPRLGKSVRVRGSRSEVSEFPSLT